MFLRNCFFYQFHSLIISRFSASTLRMSGLKAGDAFQDFVGPLGQPSEFVKDDLEEVKKRKYLFVAGGVGTAPVYPQVKWMKEHGIEADVIVGAKTKDLLILEDEMRQVAGNLYVTTDDGSYERKGMVTSVIEDLVKNQGKHYDVCVAIKLRSVYTGKFHFSAYGQTACSAHTGSVYHNRVHADNGWKLQLLSQLADKFHHNHRSDGRTEESDRRIKSWTY